MVTQQLHRLVNQLGLVLRAGRFVTPRNFSKTCLRVELLMLLSIPARVTRLLAQRIV